MQSLQKGPVKNQSARAINPCGTISIRFQESSNPHKILSENVDIVCGRSFVIHFLQFERSLLSIIKTYFSNE